MSLKQSAVVLALMALGTAQAQSISASDILADYSNSSFSSAFSVSATSPWTNTVTLGLKTQNGYTGVGVQGVTDGEIDWRSDQSESIMLTFVNPLPLASFTLGVLFNGPEYNDVREAARITINGSKTYTLTTQQAENKALWSDGSSSWMVDYIINAGTQDGAGGAIRVVNPFGDLAVNSIKFEAAMGNSGGGCSGTNGLCTNQSDYNVVNVSAVSEPQTYALMLAGLGLVGFMARRRRQVR